MLSHFLSLLFPQNSLSVTAHFRKQSKTKKVDGTTERNLTDVNPLEKKAEVEVGEGQQKAATSAPEDGQKKSKGRKKSKSKKKLKQEIATER